MLKGTIELRHDPYLLVDVQGVGYKVLVSRGTLANAPVGKHVKLFIYTHVREDAFELYGFEEAEDLRVFELLISVSGVGCKSAMSVFSIGSRSAIISAILTADAQFFTAVPRLGKKNAQKIIIELKNKVGSGEELDLSGGTTPVLGEAIQALQSFGFSMREAQEALQHSSAQASTVEEQIRLALKYLGSK